MTYSKKEQNLIDYVELLLLDCKPFKKLQVNAKNVIPLLGERVFDHNHDTKIFNRLAGNPNNVLLSVTYKTKTYTIYNRNKKTKKLLKLLHAFDRLELDKFYKTLRAEWKTDLRNFKNDEELDKLLELENYRELSEEELESGSYRKYKDSIGVNNASK